MLVVLKEAMLHRGYGMWKPSNAGNRGIEVIRARDKRAVRAMRFEVHLCITPSSV